MFVYIYVCLYFVRYAEIRYTQGGYEHLEMAKSYYSHAVKLNANNMRALYGLLQVRTTFIGYNIALSRLF